jgi:hypothetical protein
MFAQTPNGEMQTRSKLVLLLVLAVLCFWIGTTQGTTITPYYLTNVGCQRGYVKIKGSCKLIFRFKSPNNTPK